MNKRPEERLLDDVLAEASPPDFRAVLLGETLRLAKRRRRWRQTRSAGGVLFALALAAVGVWQQMQPEKTAAVHATAKISAPNSYQLVETQPLPASAVATTKNFATVKTFLTVASIAQVATTGGNFRVINDEQLLALVGGTPAVLIRTGPDSEELVFANPDDQKRFFRNQ